MKKFLPKFYWFSVIKNLDLDPDLDPDSLNNVDLDPDSVNFGPKHSFWRNNWRWECTEMSSLQFKHEPASGRFQRCTSPLSAANAQTLWLEHLTANAEVATVLGSIPASSDTVESEGRQIKQCWIQYIKDKKSPCKCFQTLIIMTSCFLHVYPALVALTVFLIPVCWWNRMIMRTPWRIWASFPRLWSWSPSDRQLSSSSLAGSIMTTKWSPHTLFCISRIVILPSASPTKLFSLLLLFLCCFSCFSFICSLRVLSTVLLSALFLSLMSIL